MTGLVDAARVVVGDTFGAGLFEHAHIIPIETSPITL